MQENEPQEDIPQEDKPPEQETHNLADSPEDRHSSRCVRRFLAEYGSWFKKHKYDVISGFIVGLIVGFTVTILGVWAAFGLAQRGQQNVLDEATKQRLYHAGFEATMNSDTAEEIKGIIDNKVDVNRVRINVKRLGSAAAVAALQDANLLSILRGEQVILLASYVNDVRLLNQSLQTYQQTLESQDFKNTNPVNGMRKLVLYNADAVRAMVCLLQEEVSQCFDDTLYDLQEIENMRERLNDIKAKYPKDEEVSGSEGK